MASSHVFSNYSNIITFQSKNSQMKRTQNLLILLVAFSVQLSAQKNLGLTKKWTPLFDKTMSQWEKYIGVPHTSVVLDGYPKSDNVTKGGTPLGLNNDPKNVMTMIEQNGEQVLYITGEIYAGLTSLSEFSNYHFKVQFKWGEMKWAPRLKDKRDSGILYHARGKHGAFWNVWMESLEFQVQETDMGDFVALNEVNGLIPTKKVGKIYKYVPGGDSIIVFGANANGTHSEGYCHIPVSVENPHGEWNTLEVVCLNNNSIHVVNGKVVMVVRNTKQIVNGKEVILDSGKIQIQSEAAECYYKNAEIKSIMKFPANYKKEAGL